MSEYRLSNAHMIMKMRPKVPPIEDVIRYMFFNNYFKRLSKRRGWGEA
jgi:hypothetical protein